MCVHTHAYMRVCMRVKFYVFLIIILCILCEWCNALYCSRCLCCILGILPIVLSYADVRQRLMEKYDVFISVKPKSRPQQKSVLLKSLEQNAHCIYEAREVILKYAPSSPSPEVPPAPPLNVQAHPTFYSSYPKMQMDPVTGDLDTSCSSSNVAISITSGSQNGCGTVQPPQGCEESYTSSKPPELGENSLV